MSYRGQVSLVTEVASALADRLCPNCCDRLTADPGIARCSACSIPIPRPLTICERCSREPLGLDSLFAACAHDGVGAALVRAYKFSPDRTLAEPMARMMLSAARRYTWGALTFRWCTVVPIPSSGRSRRRRGFAGAELLARVVGRELALPVRSMLTLTDAVSQKSLTLEERRRHAETAMQVRSTANAVPNVVLVDDVLTTGATLSQAGRLLREIGVETVHALTFAMEY